MGKNKNKKFKSGCNLLCFAPLLSIDYDKLDANPLDETAFTYGDWFRARGAEKIDLQSQFASQKHAADDNESYIVQKKNNGYNGTVQVTCLPPEFFEKICLMENFIETDETVPLAFATGWEYKEQGVKCRRILWNCELTQLPSITHTTESGDLAIDSDSININASGLEGMRSITTVCTEGEDAYTNFFTSVLMPSDFGMSNIMISGPSEVTVDGDTITLTAATLPAGAAVTWTSLDTDNATVTSGGVVTAVAAGTATIKCALTSDPTVFATKTITVNAATVGG
jgi:uncharacterized protein YjdB